MNITMAHGSGGDATSRLIEEVFKTEFHNEYLDKMEDSSVVPGSPRLSMTTDSFVVQPLFYNGGDIGRLAVCGTVNDILMSGAVPKYLTAACVLEEGLDMEVLKRIVHSMAETAKEAGVSIVTGDTKVIEHKGNKDSEPGIIINTAGVGFLDNSVNMGASCIEEGDVVIISGNIGDHHAAIMKERLGIENDRIMSDNAPLNEMVRGLLDNGVRVHAMRDVTRGGLGTVLNEFASSSLNDIYIIEEKIPVSDSVRDFCGLLGLDIMYLGNEGKMVCFVDSDDEDKAVDIIRNSKYGENAVTIGYVKKAAAIPCLVLKTSIGGERVVGPLYGEGLPRIC